MSTEVKKNKTTKKRNIQNKTKRKTHINHMEEFKQNGISALENLTKTQLNKLIHEANIQYHSYKQNKEAPILSDAEFDIAKDYLERKYPDAPALNEVGAELIDKQKVKLPINMPSMNKIKPSTDALKTWKHKYKGDYVLSCKLDGVSGLYHTMNNEYKLYTRGNGTHGQDVSHLLKAISLPKLENIMIRGEFIVKKSTFDSKYKDEFANIRNMVAGIINRKTVDKKAKNVDFVAYEVIEPVLKPSEQMDFLKKHGFNTVQYETKENVTNEILSDILMDWRNNYAYEIDGIIVTNNKTYSRLEGNPDHAFAFKMVISDQVAETQVTDVIWTASKDGYLKPRVRINPVHIGGVKIEYATGFNGNFIESNKIGIGAIIQIVRSGDVIPYIKDVTTPAESAKMPTVPYTWNDTHIDIILQDKQDDPVVLEKRITAFFTSLDVDGLSSGNVKRLIQAGYNTIQKILFMQESQFLEVDGFKEKLANKIHMSIHTKIKESSIVKIISASGTFGRGLAEKKIKPIFEMYPNILTSGETANEKMTMLTHVDGIGKENAKSFVENIPNVVTFLAECKLLDRIQVPENRVDANVVNALPLHTQHPLYGKKIIFTGFRDKPLMETLEKEYNVSFASSISKNTQIVVVKTIEDDNKKIQQANKLNIPIFTFDDFKQKFSL